jgi:8-oxo-dGTP pyrophosphatase MutT (NUDIX family)
VAAALVLVYPHADVPHLLLTVRAGKLAQHAGQVSLPGGRLEPGEAVADAALRESREEVGLDPQGVRLLGTLSTLYIPVSDFALHPVVGVTDSRPDLHIASDEVERILEISLTDLRTTAGPHRGYRWNDDRKIRVPFFEVGNERVWGATAMVLAELLAVVGAPPSDPWEGES